VGLHTLIETLRSDRQSAERTLSWRRGLLRELCRVVEGAHAKGLAHPDLTTASIVIDPAGRVLVAGWTAARSPTSREADLDALGIIAYELLTLESERRGPLAPRPIHTLPRARVVPPPLFVETAVFFALACGVAAAALGARWIAIAFVVVLIAFFAVRGAGDG
jgi:serine/threonine protein kinase